MKKIIYILIALLFYTSVNAQTNSFKQLDRKKWKELVDELKKKRYDPKERNSESQSATESEYYDRESNNYSLEDESSDNSEGIYDTNNGTSDDDIFFDKSQDKNGDNSGNSNSYGEDDIDPKYRENEGDGYGDGKGGDYDSYGNNDEGDKYYTKEPKRESSSSPTYSSSSGGSVSGGGDSTWLLIVLIVVLALAIGYMVFISFSERNKKVKHVVTDENKFENLTITKTELELALEAAIKNKNYREAVRIYFIAVIKEMKDRSWIRWEKKKTNYHYINEITGRQQQPDFITATRAFEIVWYGNRSLAENEYNQIEPLFKKLLKSIHS